MQSSTPSDLTIIALREAKTSRFEAPWYGFYGLVLSSLNRWTKNDATIIYPQLPVRFHEKMGIEATDDELEEFLDYDDIPKSLSCAPGRKGLSKNLQVTPGRHTTSDYSDLSTEEVEDSDTFSDDHGPTNKSLAKRYKELRSERIPDFCRQRYYLDKEGSTFAARLDLLVEIKKKIAKGNNFSDEAVAIHTQMQTQANYAFAGDLRLSKIICMGAAGPQWFYFLVKRPESYEELMERLHKVGHPRRAPVESPYVPSDRGSLPVTPASRPRKATVLQNSRSSSSRDRLYLSHKLTKARERDTLPVIFQHDTSPGTEEWDLPFTILAEGTFEDPSSEKEKEWITKLGELLDEIDGDIAKEYRKQPEEGKGRHRGDQSQGEEEIRQEKQGVRNKPSERQGGRKAGGKNSSTEKKRGKGRPGGGRGKQEEPEGQGSKKYRVGYEERGGEEVTDVSDDELNAFLDGSFEGSRREEKNESVGDRHGKIQGRKERRGRRGDTSLNDSDADELNIGG